MQNQNHVEPLEAAAYQPTAVQLERAKRLRRYNWLALYLPLILLGVLVVLLLVVSFWLALPFGGTTDENAASLISGLADLTLICVTLPLMLTCALLPIGFVGAVAAMRQNEVKPIDKTQTLLWRLDSLIERLQTRLVQEWLPPVRRWVIWLNGRLAVLNSLFRRIASYFERFNR